MFMAMEGPLYSPQCLGHLGCHSGRGAAASSGQRPGKLLNPQQRTGRPLATKDGPVPKGKSASKDRPETVSPRAQGPARGGSSRVCTATN